MQKIFKKEKVTFGILLILLIIIAELAIHYFAIPGWPAFAVMVFFFLGHANKKIIKEILFGGVFGITCCVLSHNFNLLFGTITSDFTAKVIFVCIFVFSIVLFKDVLPVIFNDYAFMFFLISSLAGAYNNPILIAGVELVGGSFLIAGVILIKGVLKRNEHGVQSEVVYKKEHI